MLYRKCEKYVQTLPYNYKNSPIEGLGLFATKEIKANSFIGVTHIRDEQFENKYIRTPLEDFTIIQMNQM